MALAHAPDLSRYYSQQLPPLTPGSFTFELTLRRQGLPDFSLDSVTESLEWVDEESVLTGSLSLHRPEPARPESLPITRGQLVRCRVRWAGRTYELWTMRTHAPQPIQVDTGIVSISLEDDLVLLKAGKQDWIYRATKRRPHGYDATQITRLIAARVGVKIGALATASKRQSFVRRNATPYAALVAAWDAERAASGRTFNLRLRNGKLEVVTIARNPVLYVLAEQIRTAALTQKDGDNAPTTVLEGTAKLGKLGKQIRYTATDRALVARLGHVRTRRDYGTVASPAELRQKVTRDLADGLKLSDAITIEHQGIPFIRRGDGAQLKLASEGYAGERSWVYCTRAVHTVQAGTYTTQWDFTVNDPYVAAARAQAAAQAKLRSGRRAA